MDILFENPLLIAIIIGIISAVFGKIGKQEEKEQNNQQHKPAPQNKPMPQKKAEQTSPNPVKTDQLDDFGDHGGMKKQGSQSLQDRYTATLAEMEERKSELNKEFKSLERQLTRPKASAAEMKLHVIDRLNQNTVVQGMLLGEVFGEPRAKKPHRTMKRPYKR
ncbi:hypothetical protein CHI05_07065 [Bacillus sp. 7788]|uniref:hypothetical protein n=1 Tax=Bacillus sp. 7788 TaxID=2021692 RepID=UPI000BA63552|nr:hypothetical protein [Bacillus sp. 7788]PAC82458.1 hypothetical protein CHI05_07065 [Bacillus sp. 7788]